MKLSQPGSASRTAVPPSSGALLIHRVRLLCAMVAAGVIFWHVGWWVTGPIDPQGPVSLLMVRQGVVSMAELLGLAVVASGLGVAICGAGSAERGPLAVAIGLAALASRGAHHDALVMFRLHPQAGEAPLVEPFPTTALIAETWLWLALIAVGLVVGRWVAEWFEPRRAGAAASPHADVTDVRQGLGTVVVATLAAWYLISLTIGSPQGPPLRGQIFFSLAISFIVASMIAAAFFRFRSRVWSLAAVGLVASAAYLFAAPDQASIEAAQKAGSYLVLRPMVWPLPIEYAALGAIGVLMQEDASYFIRALLGLPASEPVRE